MVSPRHPLAVALVLALILAALVGFLAGQGDARKPRPERLLTASSDGVLVDYPPGWAPTSAQPIPGLSLEQPVALGPAGSAAQAGLLAGRLPGSEPGPLPGSLVALLRQTPNAEVVELLGYQAYRYRHVRLTGFDRELTLYAVPNTAGAGSAVACFAASTAVSAMQACERIAGSLTVAEQSQSADLTPEPAFAAQLSTTIGTLNSTRAQLRGAMVASATAPTLQHDGEQLAAAFAHASSSLAAAEPTPAASAAKAALTASLQQAQGAYTAFAAAAHAESQTRLASTRSQVNVAEAAVASALQNLALLGYGQR